MRKFGDKLLTYPAKSNVKVLQEKIKVCIQSAQSLSQEALLRKLNPLLRGWANYYRHGASKRTFDRLDHSVFWQLMRWAKRRHPNKSATWRTRKYFTAAGKLWRVRLTNGESKSQVLALYTATSTVVQRHIKIRRAANPYDANYARYFEQRRPTGWRTGHGRRNVSTPLAPPQTRIIKHWLADAAACQHRGAPV